MPNLKIIGLVIEEVIFIYIKSSAVLGIVNFPLNSVLYICWFNVFIFTITLTLGNSPFIRDILIYISVTAIDNSP